MASRTKTPDPPWRVYIDTGGTFTDCLAIDPAGTTHRAKVLSSGRLRAQVRSIYSPTRLLLEAPWLDRPEFAVGAMIAPPDNGTRATIIHAEPDTPRVPATAGTRPTAWITLGAPLAKLAAGHTLELSTGEEAPILAARLVTGTPAGSPLPPARLCLATTRGTNALLQRRGSPTAFFVTRGFADLLFIGDQTRPDLFTLRVRKPRPLHDHVVEVDERLDAAGKTITPLDLDTLRERASKALNAGITVAAVTLMHAWREPRHERLVRDTLLDLGYTHVSISSDLGASIGMLARAETTVINAFLSPVIDQYLDSVQAPLGDHAPLLIMTSAGSLVDRAGFAPKDSLLSGPAGGVVGAAEAARREGFDRVISFDMGGTSTDCARCEGPPERVYQTRVGDARIVAPCVAVETVAAGGGSICAVERGEFRVGPDSAGAHPGPACYGRGGPLTVTDCNLLLGRIDPARFALPLDTDAARTRANQALEQAGGQADATPRDTLTVDALLAGFLDIANQRMAEAIRRITLRRGHDPTEHALVAFGGAGPQHACAIAESLDIDNVVIPPDAGLLSAFGLSVSRIERVAEEQVLKPLALAAPQISRQFDALETRARDALPDHAVRATIVRTVELRYRGQDDVLELDAGDPAALAGRFATRYREIFGYSPTDTPLELVTARVTATLPCEVRPGPRPTTPAQPRGPQVHPEVTTDPARQQAHQPVFTGTRQDAPIYERGARSADAHIQGPALITEPHSTTYLAPGWLAALDPQGSILMTRNPRVRPTRQPRGAEAVEVELAVGKLTAIAEEMGERLRRSAISTNVKQRRDFSCAILDRHASLVVNAPHIPVHLGSMGVCVRAVSSMLGPDLDHNTIITNHPAFGGSHLPDVTVIQPVHDRDGTLLAYAAARAHHAEIGGIAPGSMAPEATRLVQEGVVIPPTKLGRVGQIDWDLALALFSAGPHPSRSPKTNLRDLAAAVHAVGAASQRLTTLAASLGPERLDAIGATIQRRAESRLRAALAKLDDGVYQHTESVLDGGPITVRIEIIGDHASIDFAGSGPVHPRCLNATPAIVTSAVIYFLRLLVDEDLPLNEGLLRPVELRIPRGMLNPPFGAHSSQNPDNAPSHADPAVAGGNVEISQILVETMLTALGLCAQSQGTMNNVVFGNDLFGFYETLGGGCGACRGFPGESAVHSHMTNTALTDPEILEHRFPVRLERSEIRRGSGGRGTWPGGDGIERQYRFLSHARVALLNARATPPSPLHHAQAGQIGRCRLVLGSGLSTSLGSATLDAPPGALLCIQTPGGGGFGETLEAHPRTKPGLPPI